MWSLKGKHLSPLYVLHEQPSNALSEPSGPDRDFPVSQQQGHVGGADGAQILVCHHLRPPLPTPRSMRAPVGPGLQPQRAPASCPCPSLCQALSLFFTSLHLLPPLLRIRASVPPVHSHPPPPPSCLGSSFPRPAVSQLFHPAVSEKNKNPCFPPKYHPHLF